MSRTQKTPIKLVKDGILMLQEEGDLAPLYPLVEMISVYSAGKLVIQKKKTENWPFSIKNRKFSDSKNTVCSIFLKAAEKSDILFKS